MFGFCAKGGVVSGFALGLIVLMSLRPAIPRRVALLHCSRPLHQPFVMVNGVAGTVNHHLTGAGEFSTGTLGNFQPELTFPCPAPPVELIRLAWLLNRSVNPCSLIIIDFYTRAPPIGFD